MGRTKKAGARAGSKTEKEKDKLVEEAQHAKQELVASQEQRGATAAAASDDGIKHAEHDEDGEDEDEDGLTEYERQRSALIARNRERLRELGVLDAVKGLSALLVAKPKKARKAKEPSAPTRASSRLKGEKVEEPHKAEGEEETGREARELHPSPPGSGRLGVPQRQWAEEHHDDELLKFIDSGRCPRCGKQVSRSFKIHLDTCRAVEEAEPIKRTEQEKKAQDEVLHKKENEKLRALELEGLVDYTSDHATFCVLGSKKDPYIVTLADDRRGCMCIDHRVRKHDCKHIKLVLQSLGVPDRPKEWRQAVERHFQSAMDGKKKLLGGGDAADGGKGGGGAASPRSAKRRRAS